MNYILHLLWTTIFHKLLALPAASPPISSLSPLQIYIIPKILKEPSPKSEWCNVFSKVFWDFWKWTFFFVHFWFFISRFEKNVENLTQTIMVTFVFLSWKICYDKILDIFIRFLEGIFLLYKIENVYKIFTSE